MALSAKERIQNAVYLLVSRQTIDQITVNDILASANVSRPTFYRYFHDKYDVANSIYDDHISPIRAAYLKTHDYKQLLSSFYRIFYDHRAYYNNLLTDIQAQNSFFNHWETLNFEQTIEQINCRIMSEELSIAISFLIHGSMYISWDLIKGRIRLSPEETAAIVIKNMPPVLKSLLQVVE